MYCSKCGKQIRENNKFCRYCGNDLGKNFTPSTTEKVQFASPVQTIKKEADATNATDNHKKIAIIIGCIVTIIVFAVIIPNLLRGDGQDYYEDDYYYEDEYYEEQTDDMINYEQFNFEYFESYYNDFILPYSGTEQYTIEDFYDMGLTEDDAEWAINEIYARRGRIFESDKYSSYFESCDWYTGIYNSDEFDESIFNETESYNIEQLIKYSEENGWR